MPPSSPAACAPASIERRDPPGPGRRALRGGIARSLALCLVFGAVMTACSHEGPPAASAVPAAAPMALPASPPLAGVKFSLIKTAHATTREAFTWKGGRWGTTVVINHVAVLVSHPNGRFLLDSGLGTRTPEHFKLGMPWWLKPLMGYEDLNPARTQLDARHEAPIDRIVLTHGHWDHLAGLHDFPQAEVWVPPQEQAHALVAEPPGVLPLQVGPAVRWRPYEFPDRPWGPFPRSLDLFGDGSAVLVPLEGHTPGSVGLALTVASGQRFLFVGDVVWRADAIAHRAPKPPLASRIVDHDRPGTLDTVRLLADLQQADPQLHIVPAHDASVHDRLGYYPDWVE